jgi:type VI secretion system secreted protein Hcp
MDRRRDEMRSGIELPTSKMSPGTALLGVIAVAAVAIAITLFVRSGDTPEQVNADTASAPSSAPASAAYIKIGDIKGEATDSSHKEWIDILSVSQSIHQPGGSATGATRRRGAAVFGDVVVVKELDKSSPKLQESIATGEVLPEVFIELANPSSDRPFTYLKYELKNVFITNYRIQGSAAGDDRPTETFSLGYEEIKVVYSEQDATGAAKGEVEYEWKIEEGES